MGGDSESRTEGVGKVKKTNKRYVNKWVMFCRSFARDSPRNSVKPMLSVLRIFPPENREVGAFDH